MSPSTPTKPSPICGPCPPWICCGATGGSCRRCKHWGCWRWSDGFDEWWGDSSAKIAHHCSLVRYLDDYVYIYIIILLYYTLFLIGMSLGLHDRFFFGVDEWGNRCYMTLCLSWSWDESKVLICLQFCLEILQIRLRDSKDWAWLESTSYANHFYKYINHLCEMYGRFHFLHMSVS